MKLRLQGNSLRLRLTRTEVERLRDTGLVEESVDFGAGAALTYRISAASVPSLHAGFSGRAFTVQVPSSPRASGRRRTRSGFTPRRAPSGSRSRRTSVA